MRELFKLGYRGKRELDQNHLVYLKAEDSLATAVNRMATFQANRRKLTRFEKLMEEKRLRGAVETADRNLKQVDNDNESLAEQALAAKEEAVNTEKKEGERLERMKRQLVNCKIFAPHDGMVVYVRDRRSNTEIGEKATVRERQSILSLPDLSRMEVKTQVHEAVLDQVRPGLPATVRVDAFPDRVYRAVVDTVAVVPSSDRGWNEGGAKTYETIVKLVDEVESLKPGMTAVVNMHVDKLDGVFAIPVQAVIQANQETWCYAESGNSVERRDIRIGRSNDRFVHIQEGLLAGDRVVLNSMDIYDESERENNEISPESGVPELPESMAGVGFDAASESSAGSVTGGAPTRQRRGPPGGLASIQARPGGPPPSDDGGRRQFTRGQGGGAGGPSGMQGGPPGAGPRGRPARQGESGPRGGPSRGDTTGNP